MNIFRKLCCALAHYKQYVPMPSHDTKEKRGVYCLKCKATFTVSQRVYSRIIRERAKENPHL